MESNCDADILERICLEKWGFSNCHRYIGEEKAEHEETMLLAGTRHFW